MATIQAPQYHDEEAARKHLEETVWPDGPVCPHCGLIGESYKLAGKTTRKGLYKCAGCREPFTVTVGTIFEDSKIPLHKWLLAVHLMCSSKMGISAHQLWRNLWGVDEKTGKQLGSYRTAWFMAHRIRWALGREPMVSKLKGIVEVDDAYIGGKQRVGSAQDAEGRSTKLGQRHPRMDKAPICDAVGCIVYAWNRNRLKTRKLPSFVTGGVRKRVVVVEDLGEMVLVCSPEELRESRSEAREPMVVGFRRDSIVVPHKKNARSEGSREDRSSKAGD